MKSYRRTRMDRTRKWTMELISYGTKWNNKKELTGDRMDGKRTKKRKRKILYEIISFSRYKG